MADENAKKALTVFPKISSAAYNGESGILIKWTKVPLAEKYIIKRAADYSGEYVQLDSVKGTEYCDTTAEKNITYFYKVIARKPVEGKKASTKASAPAPAVISDIPAPSGIKIASKKEKITLTWNKGEGESFFIYRKCDMFSRLTPIGKTDKNSFTDETAVHGQAYHYVIQSADKENRHSALSKKVSYVTLYKGEFISVKSTSGKRIILEARLSSGADGYIFLRSDKEKGEYTEIGQTEDITANTFTDKVDSVLKTFYYKVKPYKLINEKAFYGEESAPKGIKSR